MSDAHAEQTGSVKVGFIIPEHGKDSHEALSVVAGFEMFFKEKGASGIQILKKDSGPEDEKTLEALAELVMKEEVHFLIAPPSLDASQKVVHALTQGKVILFVNNPSVRLVAGEMCLPTSFRVRANTYQSARPLAAWALRNAGSKVFITGTDDIQGNEEGDFFAYGFDKAGGSFAGRVMLPADSTNMKPVVEAITKAKPDFVFATFRGKSAEPFLKAVHSLPAAKHGVLGSESLTVFPDPLKRLGKLCRGVKTLTPMKNSQDFAAAVKQQTGLEVTNVVRAAEGYDIAQIVSKTLTLPAEQRKDPASLASLIGEIEIEGPRGKIRFDKNHEPILDMHVQEWELDGKSFSEKIVQELGECNSADFGCGRVGFPKRPPAAQEEEEPSGEE